MCVNKTSKTLGLVSARQRFFVFVFVLITIIKLLTIAQCYIPIRMYYDISVSNTVVNKTRSFSIMIIIMMRTCKLYYIRLTSLILQFCYTVDFPVIVAIDSPE